MLRLKQEIKVSPDFNRYMQHDQQSLTLNLNSLYFNELAVRCMGPAVRWFLSLFKKGNLWLSTEQLQQWVYCNVAKKCRGTKTKKLWLSCRQFFFITSSYWLSLVFLHVSQTETKKKTVASNNALQLKFFLTQSISWNIILIQFYTKNKQTNKKKKHQKLKLNHTCREKTHCSGF